MMKLLRNPEFAVPFAVGGIIAVAATAVSFAWEIRFGVLVLAVCAALLCTFYIATYKRYRRIQSLAADIDRLLHGETQIPLECYSEGELSILHSEIYKMTVCLREQQQNLTRDKVYLADSLADISHQLRTPLTSINLLVNFLSEPSISDERRIQIVHELYGLLSRIDWLITALLKISRLDAGSAKFNSERISLEELIRKAVSPILIPMELREQSLSIEASGDFCGDVSWTSEAVANIVKNCMEHTPDGGNVKICAEENPLYSQIVITDSGHGIAREDLPHIFERFYKGGGSDAGSFGIGLALARMIITAQGGTVKAENAAPSGAKFTIRFYKGAV